MKLCIFLGYFGAIESRFWKNSSEEDLTRGQKYTGPPVGGPGDPQNLKNPVVPDFIASLDDNSPSEDEELHFYPANYTGEKFYTVVYKENGEVLDYQNLKIADATVYMNTLAPKLRVIE